MALNSIGRLRSLAGHRGRRAGRRAPQRPADQVLSVSNLSVRFGDRTVLNKIDLSIRPGETVAITGTSGVGKSTLLSAVLGLIRPFEGEVFVCGHRVPCGATDLGARLRREYMGVVFQDGYLVDELTPLENVMLPALIEGHSTAEARRLATEALSQLGVQTANRPTESFSGGERQRIAIARACVNEPSLLLADEPTGSLDPSSRDLVLRDLAALVASTRCALLIATHDPEVSATADRVMVLRDGCLVPETVDRR